MEVGQQYSAADLEVLSDLRQYFPPNTPDHEMMEIYSNPELFQQYVQELQTHYQQMQDNYSVYNECIIPVLQQGWESMWLLLLYCLILRCLSMAKVPKYLLHIASFIFGCLSIWKFYESLMVYILVPVFIIFIISNIHKKLPGLVLAMLAGSYMLACEFFLMSSVEWNRIKGSVMIIIMKMISIAFDEENNIIPKLSTLEYYGYVFNPASLMFGPFITYRNYEQLFMRHPLSISWLVNCCTAVVLSFSCLIWSSCGTTNYLIKIDSYITVLQGNKWWQAYREAQQFRFSHYFICYISEATCLLMGIGTLVPMVTNNQKKEHSKTKSKKDAKKDMNEKELKKEMLTWSVPVSNILQVEFPGSLVDVVTNWNLPMHYWLKQYIFKSTRKYGVFAAILITYFASSMLHALNFQLSAVLLSIGVFAYIESVFRHALASTFNACIEARKCRKDCHHKYKRGNFWVGALNLMFALIAVWNLAYLGCLFDNSEEEDKGYSMTHAFDKWKQYSFANHALMLGLLIIQKLFFRGQVV